MKRSTFRLFIMSRKLTSYPWKACQRDISFNFASKETSATPFVQYPSFSLQCLHSSKARQIADTEWVVKEARKFNRVTKDWGSSSQSQVLLNGFLLLYVNSDHQSQLRRTSVPSTQTLCTAAVTLSIKHVLACHRLSPAVAILSEDVCPSCFWVCVQAWACASTFVCEYGKEGLTPRLFLVQYTELCLCVMLLCS